MLTGRYESARDVVQEAFVRALRDRALRRLRRLFEEEKCGRVDVVGIEEDSDPSYGANFEDVAAALGEVTQTSVQARQGELGRAM